MKLVTRAEWGGRPSRYALTRIGEVRGVAIHHTGEAGPLLHRHCAAQVRAFQAFHIDSRGWSDIAYNFLVCPHGYVFAGRGWGKRSAAQGTNLGNDGYHALCVMADGRSRFPKRQAAALGELVRVAQRIYPQGRQVKPHNAFHATTCPGGKVDAWIRRKGWRDDSARWKWAAWIATAPKDRGPRPPHPSPIPRAWWAAVRWIHRHRTKRKRS